MSTINHAVIAERLTSDRLAPYIEQTGGDLVRAIELYDWNVDVAAALHADLGRLEIVFRNAIDATLVRHGAARGWTSVWYRRGQLFPGKHGQEALADIVKARRRASRRGRREVHGKVIAELSFGFWRFLCTRPYQTSLWVPALVTAFPHHPDAGDPRAVRQHVDHRMQQLHFLRNRIAHHEPIHQRNLRRDYGYVLDVSGWICPDIRAWIAESSRCLSAVARRPEPSPRYGSAEGLGAGS